MELFKENVIPLFDNFEPDDLENPENTLPMLERLEKIMKEAPLKDGPVIDLAKANVFGQIVYDYEFVMTRRFVFNEETYLGGANGELVNADKFIRELRNFLEICLDRSK